MARGLIFNTLSQVVYVLSAMGIHFWLGRELGQAAYGDVVVILSVSTVSCLLLKNGLREATSRFTATSSDGHLSVYLAALKLQVPISVALAGILFFGSNVIASELNDLSLAVYFKIAALQVPSMGIYYLSYGFLNGRKHFGRQALLTGLYAVLRIVLIIGLVLLGMGIVGVVTGSLMAVAATAVLGLALSVRGPRVGRFPVRRIVKLAAPIAIFFASVALLMHIDILILKRLQPDSKIVGEYGAAGTFARTPFYLLSAFYGVLLPLVASARAAKDFTLVREYVSLAIRYLLLILLPGLAILSSSAREIIVLFYGSSFAGAGAPLSILCVGIGFLLLTVQLLTVSQASGKPRAGSLIMIALLPVDVLLCVVLIPRYAGVGAAIATTLAAGLGLALACGYVYATFKALLPLRSVANILLASAVVYILGKAFPLEGMPLLLFFAVRGAVYASCLMAMGELSSEDWKIFKRMFVPAEPQAST